ncbi:MAG: hypothetical protein J6M15_08340 [Prevotella sp.]|nr:hypothetical protein [Prevotella sp.]
MEDLSELLKAIYEQLVSCNEKLGGINEKLFEIENVVMDSSRSTDRIKDCVDDFQEFGVQLKGLFSIDDIYEKLVSIEGLNRE